MAELSGTYSDVEEPRNAELQHQPESSTDDGAGHATKDLRHLYRGLQREFFGTNLSLEYLHRRLATSDFDRVGDGLDLYIGLVETPRAFFDLEVPARDDISPSRLSNLVQAIAEVCNTFDFSPVTVIRLTDPHPTPRFRRFTTDSSILTLPLDAVSSGPWSSVWESMVVGDGTPAWRTASGLSPIAHEAAYLVGVMRFQHLSSADPSTALSELDSVTRALRIGAAPRGASSSDARMVLWTQQVRGAVGIVASTGAEALFGELTALAYGRRLGLADPERELANACEVVLGNH